jgi:hypothetical protein
MLSCYEAESVLSKCPPPPSLYFFNFVSCWHGEKKKLKKRGGETPGLHGLIGELPSTWALPYTCHPLAFLSSLTCLCSLECKTELGQMNEWQVPFSLSQWIYPYP